MGDSLVEIEDEQPKMPGWHQMDDGSMMKDSDMEDEDMEDMEMMQNPGNAQDMDMLQGPVCKCPTEICSQDEHAFKPSTISVLTHSFQVTPILKELQELLVSIRPVTRDTWA